MASELEELTADLEKAALLHPGKWATSIYFDWEIRVTYGGHGQRGWCVAVTLPNVTTLGLWNQSDKSEAQVLAAVVLTYLRCQAVGPFETSAALGVYGMRTIEGELCA